MDNSASPTPKWTKPSNTIKVKKRRRGSVAAENTAFSPKLSNLNAESKLSAKRKNPFCCKQKNKKIELDENQTNYKENICENKLNENNELFQRLNQGNTGNRATLNEGRQATNEVINGDSNKRRRQENEVTTNQQSLDGQIPTAYENFPIDWSIKTRLRFTSKKQFNWCAALKSSDEASGMSSFVKCTHQSVCDGLKNHFCESQEIPSSLKSKFHQHTMVWIHPSIPWFKAFPRIVPEPKIAKPSFAIASDVIEKSLFTSWCESFRSVFHLLRAKRCPYFYLCAHQFSILFQAVGVGGSKQIRAIITPTTRGFREALTREGIEFSLPSLQLGEDEKWISPEKSPNTRLDDDIEFSDNNYTPEEADYEDDDIEHDDEAASSWIQSIGLDKTEFPSLDPVKVKLKRDKVIKLDHKPQSLILIQGPDTQALFNFLLNSSTVVAVAGSQAGIPPTILAPVAFEGATLQKCKVRNSVIKQKTTSAGLAEINSLEITGVMLPDSVKGLCEVLKQTQMGCYTASLNVHEPTTPFNKAQANTANQSPDKYHLMQCGLSDHMISELHSGEMLRKGFLREVLCKDGKYSWSV